MPEATELANFTDVDAVATGDRLVTYLDAVNQTEIARSYKPLTFGLLAPAPGQRFLDVGCGTGDDAIALAELVGDGGEVVGVDSSRTMVADARRRAAGTPARVSIVHASAYSLPFADAAFDGCRGDRLMHHVERPDAALAEIVRVCRPGGRIVLSDPDWQTLVIDGGDEKATTRAITDFFAARFANGGGAHALPRLSRAAGIGAIAITPIPVVIEGLDAAEQILDLRATVESAIGAGAVTRAAADRWCATVERQDAAGSFFAAFLGLIVSGRVDSSETDHAKGHRP